MKKTLKAVLFYKRTAFNVRKYGVANNPAMHKAIFQALFGHFNGNGESSKALAAIGDETR
ncbi:hypothetical protein [Paenibacillus odorifer]|uniref:hypothetical protein n=1 Tax=Paenibacillus odorifer TaxID=189426 RepID=UPI00096F83C0|nr:hypothetical protein [Paenibacillus odorifer]OME58281.1 hypothetical protein BSK59_08865 [Paenibacillus odorifer]OZQ71515.1 hypothetical protein CA596_22345 [Paenibacillus odorifer]